MALKLKEIFEKLIEESLGGGKEYKEERVLKITESTPGYGTLKSLMEAQDLMQEYLENLQQMQKEIDQKSTEFWAEVQEALPELASDYRGVDVDYFYSKSNEEGVFYVNKKTPVPEGTLTASSLEVGKKRNQAYDRLGALIEREEDPKIRKLLTERLHKMIEQEDSES